MSGVKPAQPVSKAAIDSVLRLAMMHHEKGEYGEAEQLYRAILQTKPDHGAANYGLGRLAVKLEQPIAALPFLNAACADDPVRNDYWLSLVEAMILAGEIEAAVRLLALAHPTELRDDHRLILAGLYNNLANAQFAAGKQREAAESCRKALQNWPEFAKAHSNLGVILAGLGDLAAAEQALRQALQHDPSLLETRLNLGTILHQRVGNRAGQILLQEKQSELGAVRRQYENLPFPPRDPEAENYCLKVSNPDILAKMNQYCFAGARDFSKNFRVLVAGCGTGDSALWLAYQLRDSKAEIVALDLSEASLTIGRARAAIRGLTNIRWVQASLLDVNSLGLGLFDYISCLGVLHHLPDPEQGLLALESVLAERGAMAIMLYGAVGRSHIYRTQKLLRQLTKGLDHPMEILAFAKRIVADLPVTNEFRQRESDASRSQYLLDDTNFWDTLLHAQDRAYTASQIRDFLASAGLRPQGFISYVGNGATTSLQYDLAFHLQDPDQMARLADLTEAEREDAAEQLDGSLALHCFYATREPASGLSPSAPDAILAPMSDNAQKILNHLMQQNDGISIILRSGKKLDYRPSDVMRKFFGSIDGHRSNQTIADRLGLDAASWTTICRELEIPAALHWLTARRSEGSYCAPLPDRNGLANPHFHCEPSMLPL